LVCSQLPSISGGYHFHPKLGNVPFYGGKGRISNMASPTTIMNVGHDINELQKITAANTGVVEQYFKINN
jgi:hypothetical protein